MTSKADRDRLLWLPVRHHSPAAARAARTLIDTRNPAAILIEGPSDFTTHLPDLLLPHTLPISIMQWVRTHDDPPAKGYCVFPFTEFSAEWQAITAGLRRDIDVRFIDLPYAAMWQLEGRAEAGFNRFADPDADHRFYDHLTDYVGTRDFSAVWDEFFEVHHYLDAAEYCRRAEIVGAGLRAAEPTVDAVTRAREVHMAAHIRAALDAHPSGDILVVTGAFHTSGLQQLLTEAPHEEPPTAPVESGSALIPTSYVALDARSGYSAGQPNPGFYDRVFADPPGVDSATEIFAAALAALRAKGKQIPAADTIVALTTARALQQVRGHDRLWRSDLIEGIAAAVVKDEQLTEHPVITAVHEAFRGDKRGALAPGSPQPPIVQEIFAELHRHGITLEVAPTVLNLDLTTAADIATSQFLQRLRLLNIPVGTITADVRSGRGARAGAQTSLRQRWELTWSEQFEIAVVESMRYGASIDDAVHNRLLELAASADPDEVAAALLAAVLCGATELTDRLGAAARRALATSGDLGAVGRCLTATLRLFAYDRWLGAIDHPVLATVVSEAYLRGCLLLTELPTTAPGSGLDPVVAALSTLIDAVTAARDSAHLDPSELDRALTHQLRGGDHAAEMVGAMTGARWMLDPTRADPPVLTAPHPAELGDYYAGLLRTARPLALANLDIFAGADAALRDWGDDEFLLALPGLRRALAPLTPLEKDTVARWISPDLRGAAYARVGTADSVVEVARQEAELFARLARYTGAS